MDELTFSFGKGAEIRERGSIDIRKMVHEILKATVNECELAKDWYFIANVVSKPEAIISSELEEIRIIVKVCEIGNPSQVLTIMLNEQMVRRYCNILKPNQNYRFKNGQIIFQHFQSNYVLLGEQSQIMLIQYCMDDQSESACIKPQSKSNKVGNAKRETEQIQTKSKNNGHFNMANTMVREVEEVRQPYSLQMQNQFIRPQLSKQTFENQSSNARKQSTEFADIKGKVLCQYEIGKHKLNHGMGYLVEEINKRNKYEVVIWSEATPIPPLSNGKTYEFKSFKVNRKRDYSLSFYSHFQYSTVQELN